MGKKPELTVGLDVGTAKIAAVVSEPSIGGGLSIVGVGVAPCEGLRKGVVVNMEATVRIPTSDVHSIQEGGRAISEDPTIRLLSSTLPGSVELELGSGQFEFTAAAP